MRRSQRDLVRKIHTWTTLTLGLPFTVIAAVGLPLTYWYASDALFAPSYYAGTTNAPRASLDRLAASARAQVPQGKLQSVYLLPTYGTAQATLALPGGSSREVSLDIATAHVLGTRSLDDAVISWLYALHTRLALDRAGYDLAGRIAVMLLAAAFVVLAVSGIILWWPARWRWAVLAPTIRTRRLWLDLHNKAAIYALVPLALAATTALLLELPATRGIGGVAAPVFASRTASARLPLERLMQVGVAAAPQQPPLGIFGVAGPGPLEVMTGDERHGYHWIVVDPQSAKALGVFDERPSSLPGPPEARLLIGLHQGHRWGPIGQACFALASVMPLLVYGSGLILWLGKRSNH